MDFLATAAKSTLVAVPSIAIKCSSWVMEWGHYPVHNGHLFGHPKFTGPDHVAQAYDKPKGFDGWPGVDEEGLAFTGGKDGGGRAGRVADVQFLKRGFDAVQTECCPHFGPSSMTYSSALVLQWGWHAQRQTALLPPPQQKAVARITPCRQANPVAHKLHWLCFVSPAGWVHASCLLLGSMFFLKNIPFTDLLKQAGHPKLCRQPKPGRKYGGGIACQADEKVSGWGGLGAPGCWAFASWTGMHLRLAAVFGKAHTWLQSSATGSEGQQTDA